MSHLTDDKFCKGCKKLLPASDFDIQNKGLGHFYLRHYCRKCDRLKCRVRNKQNQRDSRYNLAPGQYETRLKEQGGVCVVCGGVNKDGTSLHVDHNHQTGKVRGLLCGSCNRALGLLKEDSKIILALADYLQRTNDDRDT